MDEGRPRLSRGTGGKVKLEYVQKDEKRMALWEPFGKGVLETIFDGDGAVLNQSLFEKIDNSSSDIDRRLKELLQSIAAEEPIDSTYSEIKINKKCPTCGAATLERIVGLETEKPGVPVMPTYTCKSCNGRSYYLSDTYLERILSNNESLLSPEEIKEMRANREAFINELKEYIIRIFASKRIMRIK